MVAQLIDTGCLRTPEVIHAFKQVPRHFFVDPALRRRAYQDTRLPIGCDQTISKPSTVARMTELLDIESGHRILEIGTGCGYQTAILGVLSKKVYSVEWHQQLVTSARSKLAALSFPTIRVEQGDGSQGWPAAAPFDRIICTAGAPAIPEAVCYQLNPGGVMVIPVGPRDRQEMTRIFRTDSADDAVFDITVSGSCEFVDLIGKNGW